MGDYPWQWVILPELAAAALAGGLAVVAVGALIWWVF